MTKHEYMALTLEIKQLMDHTREPDSDSDIAFVKGYTDSLNNMTLVRSYAELMQIEPEIPIKSLHAYILGFSLATSLLDTIDKYNDETDPTFH